MRLEGWMGSHLKRGKLKELKQTCNGNLFCGLPPLFDLICVYVSFKSIRQTIATFEREQRRQLDMRKH